MILNNFFEHFTLTTDIFFNGHLQCAAKFDGQNKGYLHFLRQGECDIHIYQGKILKAKAPCIIFFPDNFSHSIKPIGTQTIDVLCADFNFGKNIQNPLNTINNQAIILNLDENVNLLNATKILSSEVQEQKIGSIAAANYICGYVILEIIRHCISHNLINHGILLGLADKKIANVLIKMLKQPDTRLSLEEMAEMANMSRAAFAAHFKEVMQDSAINFLTNWKITIAKRKLQNGLSISQIAQETGYEHASAFTRVFQSKTGCTPSKWQAGICTDKI